MWGLGKTRTVVCPDGPRTVYKNVNDAFPLYLKEVQVAANAAAKATSEISGDVAVQYEDRVKELLYRIDEYNVSSQSHLRSAYFVYQASPCTHLEYLERAVERIHEQENALRRADAAVKMAIAAISALKAGGSDFETALSRTGESLSLAIDSLRDQPSAPGLLREMQRIDENSQQWRS